MKYQSVFICNTTSVLDSYMVKICDNSHTKLHNQQQNKVLKPKHYAMKAYSRRGGKVPCIFNLGPWQKEWSALCFSCSSCWIGGWVVPSQSGCCGGGDGGWGRKCPILLQMKLWQSTDWPLPAHFSSWSRKYKCFIPE